MPSHTHSTPTDPHTTGQVTWLKVKTRIKAGDCGTPLNHNETLVRVSRSTAGLRVKTRVKAGDLSQNHNETLVQASRPTVGLKVKTHVKAGALSQNHNETLMQTPRRMASLKVKTRVKAGGVSLANSRGGTAKPCPRRLPLTLSYTQAP